MLFKNYKHEFTVVLETIVHQDGFEEFIENYISKIKATLNNKGKLLFCGNGGSAAEAQHISAEYISKFRKDRTPIGSLAITTDTSNLTAIGNDYGFESLFSRQISALCDEKDLLVCLSTSGNSENVIRAASTAVDLSMPVIAITGQNKTKLHELANFSLCIPSSMTSHIQEISFMINHYICGEIEEWILQNR